MNMEAGLMNRGARWRAFLLAFACVVVAPRARAEDAQPPSPEQQAKETPEMAAAIQDDMTVQMEYTLSANGEVVDSTEGREPFTHRRPRRVSIEPPELLGHGVVQRRVGAEDIHEW